MQYETKTNENIYDITVKLYGSVSYCVKLCTDNDITLESDLTGLSLYYDESIKTDKNVEFRNNSISNTIDNSYFVKQQQSIYDLALMFGYGIARIVEFVTLYGWNIDTISISGNNIQVTKIKTKLSDYVYLKNIKFATNIDSEALRLLEDGEFRLLETGYFRLL